MWYLLFNEGLGGNNPPNPEKEWVIEGCETDDMSPMNPEGTEVDVHQGGYLINADIR